MATSKSSSKSQTLHSILLKQRLPANLACYVLQACGKALAASHEKGRLHLNISPSRIEVGSDGSVKLTGFGKDIDTSKLSSRNVAYVAPERLLGEDPSNKSDIFSLGASLYHMLVGEVPFKGKTAQEVMNGILKYDPIPNLHEEDDIHTQIRRICQQMLKKKPQMRYQDCRVLLADLDAYRQNRGVASIGNADEMREFLRNPEGYIDPARNITLNPRSQSSTRDRTEEKKESKGAASRKKKKKQPNVSRMLAIVGVFVLLFAGLSFAGNFFFSKDGSWGGSNSPQAANPSASQSSSTISVRRGSGQGNATVRAKGSDNTSSTSSNISVVGESEPIEVVDQSGEQPVESKPEGDTLYATTLADVDTVIILPNDGSNKIGHLQIDASPWAFVYFEGDSLGKTPLPIVTRPGTYKVVLKNPAFPSFETLVDVIPGRETPFEVSLWFLVGAVELDVVPSAQVFLDGELVEENVSDVVLPVSPGTHTLTLVHPTLGSYDTTFDVAAGERITLDVDLNELL